MDIEKNAALRFKDDPELKKQLSELKALRERMENTLAEEVKAVQELRLGDSPNGIEGKIPGAPRNTTWRSSGNSAPVLSRNKECTLNELTAAPRGTAERHW